MAYVNQKFLGYSRGVWPSPGALGNSMNIPDFQRNALGMWGMSRVPKDMSWEEGMSPAIPVP